MVNKIKIIEKKCWSKYFQAIMNGKKNFELRIADFECKVGDILILREWDPKTKKYTGRKLKKKITYVLKTKEIKFFNKRDIEKYSFQVFSLDDF